MAAYSKEEKFFSDNQSTLREALDLPDMGDQDRAAFLKDLDQEISILEKAQEIQSSDKEDLSPGERREAQWIISWEKFSQTLEKSCDIQALLFKKECDVKTQLALAKLYDSCGDTATAEQYLEKAVDSATEFGYMSFTPGEDALINNPFSNDQLENAFHIGWKSAEKQHEKP